LIQRPPPPPTLFPYTTLFRSCTKAAYDPCNDEHDCDSGNCHLFMADGFQVCTTACSATLPCPNDSSGAPGTCNTMMICKPAAARSEEHTSELQSRFELVCRLL